MSNNSNKQNQQRNGVPNAWDLVQLARTLPGAYPQQPTPRPFSGQVQIRSTTMVLTRNPQPPNPVPTPVVPASGSRTRLTVVTVIGGAARRAAAAEGQPALMRFDAMIEVRLVKVSKKICPKGFKYYLVNEGYLCCGGNHLITHDEADAMLAGQRPGGVRIETVNATPNGGERAIAPPRCAWEEPFHWSPEERLANGMVPLPKKADGTFWSGFGPLAWSN